MIDIDVNDRTKSPPCQTEGCGWPNWHVCILGKPDLFPILLDQRRRKKQTNYFTGPKPDAWRNAISEANAARWARIREANGDRDEQIIERYAKGDIGMMALSKVFDMHVNGVRNILQAAAAKGRIQIRRPGHNIVRRNPELEARVIERYKAGGIGIEPMAAEMGITRDVARKILLVAQKEGLVTIRRPGTTVAKGAA